ncbi:MAG TPA: hypothetical protein VK914_06510 [bacterium]|nr:hypothetical protein [bacterium]
MPSNKGVLSSPLFPALLSLLFCGCATLPPPYQKPPAGTSLQDRQKIYDDHKVAYGYWSGGRVGEKATFCCLNESGQLAKYFEASGDTLAASLARKACATDLVGLGSVIGTLAAASALVNKGDFARVAGDNLLWVGFPAELILSDCEASHDLVAAKNSFNDYLKRDLDLPEAPSVMPEPKPVVWSVEPELGWLFPGARYVDQNNQLRNDIGNLGWENTREIYGQAASNIYEGVGMQRTSGWMQLGFGYRYFDFGTAFATATGDFGGGQWTRETLSERNRIQSLYFSFGGVHDLGQALRFSLALEAGLGWDDLQENYSNTGYNGSNFNNYTNENLGGEAFWGTVLATLEYRFSERCSIAVDGGFDDCEAEDFIVVSGSSNNQTPKADTYADFYGVNSRGTFDAGGAVGSVKLLWYL